MPRLQSTRARLITTLPGTCTALICPTIARVLLAGTRSAVPMQQHHHYIFRRGLPRRRIILALYKAGIVTAIAAAALLVSTAAGAATPECSKKTFCEFQLYIENDSFGGGTDRYYTNGIKFGGGMDADPVSEWLFQAPAKRVLRQISDNLGELNVGLFLGQNMYTPKRITISQPQPLDRPWAAWLYAAGVAQSVLGNRLQTVELDLGVIGSPAMGREVQTEWHRLVGADRPQGWSNQLHTEPGVLLAYLEKWRYGPTTGVQAIPHFGATLGNVMTLVRVGGTVRFGHNMSGFGPDTIEPGGAMLQRTRLTDDQSKNGGREWYVFTGFDTRAIARNIFLDGNTFRDSPSVDRKVMVHDIKTGISMRFQPVRVSLTHVRRSEEFTTATAGGGVQQFYSLNASWDF